MLHLMKLAVGIRDVPSLQAAQAARASADPPLRHRTRHMPRRAEELLAGGSIYWVIAGSMLVRQSLRALQEDHWEDGSRCAALLLDPALVPVAARGVKAFQGWRYLPADDAPPDLSGLAAATGEAALPEAMRRELRALCLL